MVRIALFCGILYGREAGGDLSSLVSPPYDVVSAEEKERYHKSSPYNSMRLILPELSPDDANLSETYARVARLYSNWRKTGILIKDQAPSIYIVEREFSIQGAGRKNATGFIASMSLEGKGSDMVLPHEQTSQAPKMDRLSLLRACQVNFSPIFCLYRDPSREILGLVDRAKNKPPLADFAHSDGTHVKMWAVSDPSITGAIAESMESKKVIIADGHHRYAAALSYSEERRFSNPGHSSEEAYNFLMAYFADINDHGLCILPVHRLLRGLCGDVLSGLDYKLSRWFRPRIFEFSPRSERRQRRLFFEALMGASDSPAFGMFAGGDRYYLFVEDKGLPCSRQAEYQAACQTTIGVTVLHKFIFPKVIGLMESGAGDSISYTKSEEEALRLVNAGTYQVAFFLRPLQARQIEALAGRRETLPEKSTYFHPKLLTGLVMREL